MVRIDPSAPWPLQRTRIKICITGPEYQGGDSIALKRGPKKGLKKGPKVNFLQAYASTLRKSPAYTVSGPFLLRRFQS